MKELNLLLQLPQDVSTRYRSVDMTVLAPEQPSLVQLPCAKTQEFCKAEFLDSTPVSALLCFLRLWNRQFVSRIQRKLNSGFGLGLLVSRGF